MRTNHRLQFLIYICLCVASACQIERDTPTDPRRQEDPPRPDGSTSASNDNQAGDNGESNDDGRSGDDGQSGGQKEPSDDSMASDAGTSSSSSAHDANVASLSDASVGAGGTCTAPKVDGCNPVKNEGCLMELAMQCAVDPLALTLAGYCTFSAPSDAGDCLNTYVTESCPPTHTCFEGKCRKLCFCDGDCQQGSCCVERIGDHGFKACGQC